MFVWISVLHTHNVYEMVAAGVEGVAANFMDILDKIKQSKMSVPLCQTFESGVKNVEQT